MVSEESSQVVEVVVDQDDVPRPIIISSSSVSDNDEGGGQGLEHVVTRVKSPSLSGVCCRPRRTTSLTATSHPSLPKQRVWRMWLIRGLYISLLLSAPAEEHVCV